MAEATLYPDPADEDFFFGVLAISRGVLPLFS